MSETYDAAMEALETHLPDEAEVEPDQPVESSADEGTPDADIPASREVDLSQLPEEAQIFLRAREREMQADATRKWQEAAELRKQAEQAVQFVEALNTDPDFALQVREYLENQLSDSGYLAADDYEDVYGEPDVENPYQAELAELQKWRAQVEAERQMEQLSANLDRQIAHIQADHPDWSDDDLNAVADLGFATDGDLYKAAEAYQAMQDRILAAYIQRKGSVTAPPVTGSGVGAPAPEKLASATDEELRNAAMEYVRNAGLE